MWFIYLLSWLSLVLQISFVTLAIGRCCWKTLANTRHCLLAVSRWSCCRIDFYLRGQASLSNSKTLSTIKFQKPNKPTKHKIARLEMTARFFFCELATSVFNLVNSDFFSHFSSFKTFAERSKTQLYTFSAGLFR